MEFPIGTYYQIIAGTGSGERALRIESRKFEEFNNSRILGTRPDSQDIGQLFMVQKTGLNDDSWEIVNCVSNLVFDEQSRQIRLKRGKRVADQLFKIENAKQDFYWIKCDEDDNMAVCLEGIIRYKPFNPNDPAQMFRFRAIKNKNIENSNMIINASSGKALDIPSATFEPDTRIIQYGINKRFNQRWVFKKYGNAYLIVSLFNGLVLDISRQRKQGGSEVVQWKKTGKPNQLWIPQPAGSNSYKIASQHAPGMFLCIMNQSVDDYGQLEIWDSENPSMYWEIPNLCLTI